MKNWLLWLLSAVAVLVIGIPAIVYYCQFGGDGLSIKTADWGTFGDFMNVWVNVAGLILLGTLTFHIHQREQHLQSQLIQKEEELVKEKEAKEDMVRQEAHQREVMSNRPVVNVFQDFGNRYYLKNIGNGPAINVVARLHINTDLNPGDPQLYGGLGVGDRTANIFANDLRIFYVSYRDIFDNPISTRFFDDKNTFKIGVDWTEIPDETLDDLLDSLYDDKEPVSEG